MAAVLRVDLREAEDLAVRQRPFQLLLYLVQIVDLLGRERQTLLLVVFLQVLHMLDGLRLSHNGEDALVEAFIHALEHGVVVGILARHGEILLNARDAVQVHVLRYLHGVRTPRRDHLAPRAYEEAFLLAAFQQLRIAIQPTQFVDLLLIQLVVNLGCYHTL